MTALKAIAVCAGAGAALVAAAPLAGSAQTPAKPPAKRTILQKADVAQSPAQETYVGTVEIAPGSGNAFHCHYGTEIGVVVEGRVRIEIKGQPPKVLGPGDSFLVPREAVHRSVLLSPGGAKLISSWTIDKGAPVLIPLDAQGNCPKP